MVANKLAIKNAAALKLGEPPMTAGDTTPLATTLDAHYDRVRKIVLKKSRWKFATQREHTQGDENQNSGSGFAFAHAVSDELLHLSEVWSGGQRLAEKEYSWEARCIFSDYEELDIKFIYDEEDVDYFPDDFVEAFACYLAAEATMYISNSRRSKESLMADYFAAVTEAKHNNLIESPHVDQTDPYDDWDRSRHAGPVF